MAMETSMSHDFRVQRWLISRHATRESEEALRRRQHCGRGFHREELRAGTGGVQVALHGATTQTFVGRAGVISGYPKRNP